MHGPLNNGPLAWEVFFFLKLCVCVRAWLVGFCCNSIKSAHITQQKKLYVAHCSYRIQVALVLRSDTWIMISNSQRSARKNKRTCRNRQTIEYNVCTFQTNSKFLYRSCACVYTTSFGLYLSILSHRSNHHHTIYSLSFLLRVAGIY